MGWFLCAVHRIVPSRAESYVNYGCRSNTSLPLEHLSSLPPWFRDIDPNKSEDFSECDLPTLPTSNMLPLAHWAGIFYAVVGEITFLYHDLKSRYGQRMEQGGIILHEHGMNDNHNTPVSVWDLAQLLELHWDILTNPRLLATLNYAVMQHAAMRRKDGDVPTLPEVLQSDGLEDIQQRSYAEIAQMLAEEYAQDVKIAVRTNVKEVTEMLACNTAMHERRTELQKIETQSKKDDSTEQSSSRNQQIQKTVRAEIEQLLTQSSLSQLDAASERSSPKRRTEPKGSRSARKEASLAYVGERNIGDYNPYRDYSGQRYPQEATSRIDAPSPAPKKPYFYGSTPSRKPLPAKSTLSEEGRSQRENDPQLQKASTHTTSTRPTPLLSTQPSSDIHESFETARTGPGAASSSDGDAQLVAATSPPPPARSPTAPTAPSPFGPQGDPLNPVPRARAEQRYVSAGGDAPLHRREVLGGFELPMEAGAAGATFSAGRDELFARISAREQLGLVAREEEARRGREGEREREGRGSVWRRVTGRKSGEQR